MGKMAVGQVKAERLVRLELVLQASERGESSLKLSDGVVEAIQAPQGIAPMHAVAGLILSILGQRVASDQLRGRGPCRVVSGFRFLDVPRGGACTGNVCLSRRLEASVLLIVRELGQQ